MFNELKFRDLTKKIIASEIDGFWSDWTKEQQELYISGQWEKFSRSRGYSDEQIFEYKNWLIMIKEGLREGMEVFKCINDLTSIAAIKNINKDVRGEILLSSKFPELEELLCHG